MNRFLKLYLCAFAFLYFSCQKESSAPAYQMEGTWTVKSIKGDFAGEINVEIQAFLATFYPCVYDITYSLKMKKLA